MSEAAKQPNQHIFLCFSYKLSCQQSQQLFFGGHLYCCTFITLLFILSWLCERKAEQQTKTSGINTSKRAIQGLNIKAGELCNTSSPWSCRFLCWRNSAAACMELIPGSNVVLWWQVNLRMVSLSVYTVKLKTDSRPALWALITGCVGTGTPHTATVKAFSLHSHHLSYQVWHPPSSLIKLCLHVFGLQHWLSHEHSKAWRLLL